MSWKRLAPSKVMAGKLQHENRKVSSGENPLAWSLSQGVGGRDGPVLGQVGQEFSRHSPTSLLITAASGEEGKGQEIAAHRSQIGVTRDDGEENRLSLHPWIQYDKSEVLGRKPSWPLWTWVNQKHHPQEVHRDGDTRRLWLSYASSNAAKIEPFYRRRSQADVYRVEEMQRGAMNALSLLDVQLAHELIDHSMAEVERFSRHQSPECWAVGER